MEKWNETTWLQQNLKTPGNQKQIEKNNGELN